MSKLWKGQQTVQLIAEWCHLGLVMFREDAWGTPAQLQTSWQVCNSLTLPNALQNLLMIISEE